MITFPVSDQIMEWSFWAALSATIVIPTAIGFFLHQVVFKADRKIEAVPDEAYRICELREFLDMLWIKLYGKPIDDFMLGRIERALGDATVDEFRLAVHRAVPDRGFTQPHMFISLACRAALDAEISKTCGLGASDVVELENIFKEPVHRS